MGAIAEAIVSYAQPLFDQTDGSVEEMEKAMAISQLCWNMALAPEDGRAQVLNEMRLSLQMDAAKFDEFRRSILDPIIRRHQEMFPPMHQRGSTAASPSRPSPWAPSRAAAGETYPGTDAYALCPCKSERKYKFCCRRKVR